MDVCSYCSRVYSPQIVPSQQFPSVFWYCDEKKFFEEAVWNPDHRTSRIGCHKWYCFQVLASPPSYGTGPETITLPSYNSNQPRCLYSHSGSWLCNWEDLSSRPRRFHDFGNSRWGSFTNLLNQHFISKYLIWFSNSLNITICLKACLGLSLVVQEVGTNSSISHGIG